MIKDLKPFEKPSTYVVVYIFIKKKIFHQANESAFIHIRVKKNVS